MRRYEKTQVRYCPDCVPRGLTDILATEMVIERGRIKYVCKNHAVDYEAYPGTIQRVDLNVYRG